MSLYILPEVCADTRVRQRHERKGELQRQREKDGGGDLGANRGLPWRLSQSAHVAKAN